VQGKREPKPSMTGAGAVTESGQTVRLYSATLQQPGKVVPQGQGQEALEVLDIASSGCRLTVQQIAGTLIGQHRRPEAA